MTRSYSNWIKQTEARRQAYLAKGEEAEGRETVELVGVGEGDEIREEH
jgi:hypothetical protein